jgi:hypothetical protein
VQVAQLLQNWRLVPEFEQRNVLQVILGKKFAIVAPQLELIADLKFLQEN